jgi:hypothetical protein
MAGAVTGYHAAHLPEDPARAVVWKVVAEHLSEWVPAGARVLEIGAGYCAWINNVVAARRVAVDIWPDVVRHANDGVEARVLDASRDLPTLGDAAVRRGPCIEHPRTLRPWGGRVGCRRCWPGAHARRTLHHHPAELQVRSDSIISTITRNGASSTDVSLPNLLRAHGFAIDRVDPRFFPIRCVGRSGRSVRGPFGRICCRRSGRWPGRCS